MTDPYCNPNDPLRALAALFSPFGAHYPLVLCCQNLGTPSKVEGNPCVNARLSTGLDCHEEGVGGILTIVVNRALEALLW
jgi:hypothetical protein